MTNDFEAIKDILGRILRVSRYVHENNIDHVHILINPAAGCFSHEKKYAALISLLKAFTPKTELQKKDILITLSSSQKKGDLGCIALDLMCKRQPNSGNLLMITMGGDGTHHEVLSAITGQDPKNLKSIWIFRFPAGTGNDSADAWTQEQALQALCETKNTGKLGAVKVITNTGKPLYSFNIASLGIDAYVVYLNNKLQKILPGNFYRLFSDIGVLFYGMIHGYRIMSVRRTSSTGSIAEENRKNAIMVMGVSGFRTYGNEKWVLPDERNYCSILKGNIIANLKFKSMLFQARHPELDSCTMDTVTKAEVRYQGKILMQLDGEVFQLETSDFPITFETVETGIQYLSAKETETQSAILVTQKEQAF